VSEESLREGNWSNIGNRGGWDCDDFDNGGERGVGNFGGTNRGGRKRVRGGLGIVGPYLRVESLSKLDKKQERLDMPKIMRIRKDWL